MMILDETTGDFGAATLKEGLHRIVNNLDFSAFPRLFRPFGSA
jgi:hypothetical protein